MAARSKRCKTCQFKPCRCADLAAGETLTGVATTGWPLVSEALACHPKQVAEMNARNKKHGIRVEYDRKGFAHIPDRGERRKLLKLERMVDRNSFYGN